VACLLLAALMHPAAAQESAPGPESGHVDLGGIDLHYLDFGGEGPAILLLHSKPWDASTYESFGQRFVDGYRVVAPTFRGSGESSGEPADVATDGEDILRFMDAMEIDQAVLIGNSTPGLAMTYLAEHHADRIAGLVYMAPGLPLGDLSGSDSLRIWEMTLRAQGDNYERIVPQAVYRPHYRSSAQPTIDVPAMILRNQSGGSGVGTFNVPRLLLEGQIPINDPEAERFWEAAREDPGFGARVDAFWAEMNAGEADAFAEFDGAFSSPPTVVPLPLPAVGGYEYREAPDLVEPHIRSFLSDVFDRGTGR